MRIACVGGGPAGLYFANLMKLQDPSHEVTVFERNRPGDTFGWGVVFSDQTMDHLEDKDPKSARAILEEFAHWDDVEVVVNGARVRSSGHGFCGIGRKRLLNILQDRARELDVDLRFEVELEPNLDQFEDYDLVVASDGVNSKIRSLHEEDFGVDRDVRRNKFVWLGTHQKFDAFTFIFEETEHGWIWAHAYKFDADTATFICECSPETWEKWGFGDMTQDESCRTLERIFADHLGGHELISNARHLRSSAWLNFPRILCDRWRRGNVVLLGDAAHTAHFSIGSGTKLALEDAISLSEHLAAADLPLDDRLQRYEDERSVEVLKIQNAARNSTEWFENVERYLQFAPMQFAYSLLTRSQRISHENLRLRDAGWLREVENWYAEEATGRAANTPTPPMFTPFHLRAMTLENRVVVSPMATYSATDGTPDDFHLVHYGSRAMGGAGLVFTEMTCVSPTARITPGCTGMYAPDHVDAWRRVVDFVHARSNAKICLQLGHAGAKGATKIGWEGMDEPLESGGWDLIAPSDVAWSPENKTPRPMTRADMDEVRDQFVRATDMAQLAGFDMVELHCAHGYLLSAFLTPVQNTRTDEYGGSLENRLRYPLEVFHAMRDVWPDEKPMSVRISATDWVGDAGVTPDEATEIARAFKSAGADLIDVSAGQTTRDAKPVYGRMFQTPFSDQIRNSLGCATMAVGNIYEVDHANSILAAGRADLVALARPHLVDPSWSIRAAAQMQYDGVAVPPPYLNGFSQLKRNMARAAAEAEAMRA